MSIGFDPGSGGGTGLPAADQSTLDWLNGLTAGQQQPQPDYGPTPQSGAEDYNNYDPYAGAPPTQGQGYSDYVDQSAQPDFSSGISAPDQTQPNFYLDQTPSLPDFSAGLRQQQDNAPVFQSGPWQGAANNTEPTFSAGVDTSGQNPDQGFTQDFNESPVNHYNPDETPWVQDPDGVWRQHGPNDYRRTTAFQYTQNNLGEGLQASGGRPTTNAQSLGTVYWDPNARGDYSPDQTDPMRGWFDGTRQQKWQSEYRTAVTAQAVNPTPQGAALVKQLEDEMAQWNTWVNDYNAGAAERAGHGYTSQDLADRRISAEILTNRLPIDQAITEWNNDAPARRDRAKLALATEFKRQDENYHDNPAYGSYPTAITTQVNAGAAGETFDLLLAAARKGAGFGAVAKQYGVTPSEQSLVLAAASAFDPAQVARIRQEWIDSHAGTAGDRQPTAFPNPQRGKSLADMTWEERYQAVLSPISAVFTGAIHAVDYAAQGAGSIVQGANPTLAAGLRGLAGRTATDLGVPADSGPATILLNGIYAKDQQMIGDIILVSVADSAPASSVLGVRYQPGFDYTNNPIRTGHALRQQYPEQAFWADQVAQFVLDYITGRVGASFHDLPIPQQKALLAEAQDAAIKQMPMPGSKGNPPVPDEIIPPPSRVPDLMLPSRQVIDVPVGGSRGNISSISPVGNPVLGRIPPVEIAPAIERPVAGGPRLELPDRAVVAPDHSVIDAGGSSGDVTAGAVTPPARPTAPGPLEPRPPVSSIPDTPISPAQAITPEVRTAFNTFMDSPRVRKDPYIPSVEYIARNSGATVPEANALIQEALTDGRLRVINTGRGADIAFVPRKSVSSIPDAPIVAPGASQRATGAFTKSDVDKLTSTAYYDQPKAIGNAVRAHPDVQERALRSIERINADPKLAAKLRQRDPALAARVLDGAAPDVAPKPAVSVPEPYNTQPAPRTVPAAKPPLRQTMYDRIAELPEYEGASAAEIRAAADREIATTYGKNAKYGEFRPDQLVDTPAAATPEVAPRTSELTLTEIEQRAVVDEYKAALQRGDPGEIKYQRDLASSYGVSDNWLTEVERNAATDRIASDPVARMSQIQDRINEIDHAPEAVVFNYVNANGQLRAVNPDTGKRIVPPRNATDNLGRPTGKFGKQPEAIWNIPGSGYDDLAARVPGYNPRHAESMDDFFPRALEMWQERRQLKQELQALRTEAGKTAPNTPVGTLAGTPAREFGGTQYTNLADAPVQGAAAPLKLEMQYGGLPDAEVARIKAQEAGQGNLFDTGAPKKGITRKSVQNDPMLYSIGPGLARQAIFSGAGYVAPYAAAKLSGQDDETAQGWARNGLLLTLGMGAVRAGAAPLRSTARKVIYGGEGAKLPGVGPGIKAWYPADTQRAIAADRVDAAFFHGLNAELTDKGLSLGGEALAQQKLNDARAAYRSLVTAKASAADLAAGRADIKAAALAYKNVKGQLPKTIEAFINNPTAVKGIDLFGTTEGKQVAAFVQKNATAFKAAMPKVLQYETTLEGIAGKMGDLAAELAKNELRGKGVTPQDPLLIANRWIVQQMAGPWMTWNPYYHVANNASNLTSALAQAVLSDPLSAVLGVTKSKAIRRGREGIGVEGTGRRYSAYVEEDLTGGPNALGEGKQQGYLARGLDKVTQSISNAAGTVANKPWNWKASDLTEGLANKSERFAKGRVYNGNLESLYNRAMKFETGTQGLDLGNITTLFNDHFAGDTPRLTKLPDALKKELANTFRADDVQTIAQEYVKRNEITPAQAGEVVRVARSRLANAEAYADYEAGWALRRYPWRSRVDYALDHITPLHYWTTNNLLQTARLAAKAPWAVPLVIAGVTHWANENHESIPDFIKHGVKLPIRDLAQHMADNGHDELLNGLDNIGGKGTEIYFRPWGWLNPAVGGAFELLTPEQKAGVAPTASKWETFTDALDTMGYHVSPIYGALGTALRRVGIEPEIDGTKVNEDKYFAPSLFGRYGTFAREGLERLAHDHPDNQAAQTAKTLPDQFNRAVFGRQYSQSETDAIAKIIADKERLGQVTHTQALNALKNRDGDKTWDDARSTYWNRNAGKAAVSWAGAPVSYQNDYQRAVKQGNADYFGPAKSKDDRKAFLTDKQWLTTDWAKDDPSATIQLSQDIDAYFKLPSPKSGLAPEENKRRAAAQKAFIAAHPQVQKVLDNAFAAKTLNIQDYELEVGGRKASDEYYALVDKYGYDDPRVKSYEQKNHDLLTAYRQRDMTPDQVRDDNGTYVLMQTVGQYFELPGPKKGETPEENKRRAATQEAFLVAHPEVRQYLNNIEGGRNDQGLVDTTAHKLQLQRQAEYFDFKARGETGKAARALAQSPDIPSQEYGLWDDTNGQAVFQQQQNQQIMGDTNPSGRTPAEELAYKAAMDQLGPYPANGSDTAKELWIANAKKIGWHSDAPTDPVQQWFDTHPYPENGTSAEKAAWAVAARKAGWVPSDEDPLKRMGGGLVGGVRIAAGVPYKTTPANDAPSTDPLKRWMNENPYPEKGTSAQKAAWVAEATKRGWKSTPTTTATTTKPTTTGGGTSTGTTSHAPSTPAVRTTSSSAASSPKVSSGTSSAKTPTVSPGSKTPTGLPSSSPYTTKSANQSSAANRSPGNPITGVPFSEGLSQWTDAQRNARPFISTVNAAATKSPASTVPVGSTAPVQSTDKPFSPSAYQSAVKRYTANPDSNSLNTITGMLKKLAAKGTDITPYAWQVVRDLEKSIVPRIKAYQGPDRATGDRIRGQMLAAIKQITPDLDGLQLLMEIQGALG